MSGRFAGSKSVDDRRRRRLAAEDSQPAAVAADSAEKPLPARRPTARFPLQRIVSRSCWKLAGAGGLVFLLSGAALASGYVPAITTGVYGPGVAAWCSAETGRLPTVLSGLLLLASGQAAWLIRWARARSLRDFRGSYRVWWWTALTLFAGGFSQLTAAHDAVAVTTVWLTGRTPFGSDDVFRLLPAGVALVVLLPALQRDMRDCRTSRSLLLLAAALWVAGGCVQLTPEFVGRAMQTLTVTLPVAALPTGLLLAGAACLSTAFLFHARHVVYESVEPPVMPVRRTRNEEVVDEADAEVDTKPKRASSRRSSRAKADAAASGTAAAAGPTEAKAETRVAAPKPAEKPAPVVKAEPKPRIEPKIETKVETKTESIRQESAPQPAPVHSKPAPVASKSAPAEDEDWSDDEDTAADGNGRQYRLDEAQDSLKGLSKRERRKQRKAMKDRDRMGL